MKLYTCYSPSHNILFEKYFKATLPKDEYELVARTLPQECPNASFASEGWAKTTYHKLQWFHQASIENDIFVWSDVDLQFFGHTKEVLLEELGDHDAAFQRDGFSYLSDRDCACTGFFIARGNNRFVNILETALNNYQGQRDDQTALNTFKHLINWKYLSNRFFTIPFAINDVWTGQNFSVPPDILTHHANWTVGVENKIRLLDLVREKISRR